ncbi:KIF3C [Bugula neritina]|uniref:Kinesin-like protein n=1 Tax=Bugula neritina TaxID=10212 RepID=A0A7J7JWI0_BUGNE|nr:KIF3C [Bugula neritina]
MSKKSSKSAECVRVIIRCRPMSEKETKDGHERVVDMDTKRGVVSIRNPKDPSAAPKEFTFDSVYDWNSKQQDLYEETFRDLVESVLDGFNGTVFAYGQTGTGKTFTMQGVKSDPELRGMIPNSFEHIFQHISRSENQQYLVRASYLEIYQEEIRDLLSKDQSRRLELKERPDTGVYVKDLSSFVTKSVKEIEHVMNVGDKNRSVGATNMNLHSSRSHAIFIITVECSQTGADNENHIRVGKLNLVDLAGSERQSKTGAEGQRLKEATKINLSLSALGNVISALVDGKSSHVPYRDSKLTRLLQDSLGGNAKTVMVANVGPASYNFDETVTTLRWANRAKSIKNKPKINEDPKDALLREFQEEIARLKAHLENKGPGGGGGGKKKKRRRTKRGPDGEVVEVSDDDGNDEESTEDFEKQQWAKLEEEKETIMSNKNMLSEEKEKILQELSEREDRLMKEKEAKEALAAKIKAMEGKLLSGGDIVDHTNEQERALQKRRHEIAEQKRKEREMLQSLEKQEETAVEIKETYNSLQQEVDVKTKKLKKLFNKLQQTRQEMQELQEEHIRERQELEQTQEELTRELKLKMLIIDNFIPAEDKQKVQSRAVYDEDKDQWTLSPFTKANPGQMMKKPVSALNNRRPVSQYAKMAATMGGNPRYKGENILSLELDMPNRTTRDYEGPSIAPRVQAAIDAALQDEEDIDIDGTPSVLTGKKKSSSKKKNSRLTSAKANRASNNGEMFPSARGLVGK